MDTINTKKTTEYQQTETLIAAYTEVCKSYNAIDDFRMKLLGLLPLSSLVGIVLLNRESVVTATSTNAQELIGFAGVFAFLLTIALFLYEIRGILKCDHLVTRGILLENELNVRGQFFACSEESERAKNRRLDSFFSDRLASSIIYSVTIAAWLFVALRFGVGIETSNCVLMTAIFGSLLAAASYFLIQHLIEYRRL